MQLSNSVNSFGLSIFNSHSIFANICHLDILQIKKILIEKLITHNHECELFYEIQKPSGKSSFHHLKCIIFFIVNRDTSKNNIHILKHLKINSKKVFLSLK